MLKLTLTPSVVTVHLANGDRYEGEMHNGRRHGKGTLFFANGNELHAEFVDGVPHGHGEMRFKNNDVYEGDFRNGMAHGRGRLTRSNGQIYEAGAFSCFLEHSQNSRCFVFAGSMGE